MVFEVGDLQIDIVSFLAGGLAAFAGIAVAIGIARRGRRVFKVEYSRTTRRVISASKSLPKLEISFDGVKIESLFTTDIAIFNSGTETVEASQISTVNPISVSVPEGVEVYGIALAHESRSVCKFEYEEISDHKYLIRFEYMDAGDIQ